jgi:hypothetical protein
MLSGWLDTFASWAGPLLARGHPLLAALPLQLQRPPIHHSPAIGQHHGYAQHTVLGSCEVEGDGLGSLACGGGFLNHYLEKIVDLTAYGKPLALGVLIWTAAWSVMYGAAWAGELKKKGTSATS